MPRRQTIEVVITAKDLASKALKEFTIGALRRLGEEAINLARQLPRAAIELVQLGASAERQETAINNLAASFGASGAEIIAAIQEASDFTIDKMTAMSAANKALLLGVAKTPEEFARITKTAVALGRAMGVDAAQSINDFVTAAGRQSIMIADNLGLMIKQGDLQEDVNRIMGETPGITEAAAKSQAFLNAMLESGEEKLLALGDTSGGTATDIEKLEVAFADAKLGFAEMAAGVVSSAIDAAGGIDNLVLSLNNFFETVEGGAEDIAGTTSKIGMMVKATVAAYSAAWEGRDAVDAFNFSIERSIGGFEDALTEYDRMKFGLDKVTEATEKTTEATEGTTEAIEGLTRSVKLWEWTNREAGEGLGDLAEMMGGEAFHVDELKIRYAALRTEVLLGSLAHDEMARSVGWVNEALGSQAEKELVDAADGLNTFAEQSTYAAISVEEYQSRLEDAARETDRLAREAEILAEEIENAAAVTGDDFVLAVGDAIVESDNWAIALFEAADAAGADAAELALLAGGLGIYTDEQIAAALATVALTATIDNLGAAIADGSITIDEAIETVMAAVDALEIDISLTNRSAAATGRATGATRGNTKARKNNTRAKQEAARAERELERALTRTGDFFTDALSDMEMATEATDLWAIALFEAADAAGADATELALLAGALGLYTEEQVKSALAAAAMQEMLEKLGAEIAAGLGMDEAIEEFNRMRDELGLPEWLEPGSATPLELGLRGISSAMQDLAGIDLPRFQASLEAAGGGAGTQIENNFTMHVSTQANISTVQEDFATMAALAA